MLLYLLQVVTDIPFEQIKEITGVDDVNRIRKAWNNCSKKGNNQEATIAEVIAALCQTPIKNPTDYDVISHFNENHVGYGLFLFRTFIMIVHLISRLPYLWVSVCAIMVLLGTTYARV